MSTRLYFSKRHECILLHIMKMNLHTKNDICISRHSKVTARTGQTDTQTDATERITKQHLQVVTNII